MIYYNKDLGDYYHYDSDRLYHDLRACKREQYEPDDCVLVRSYTQTGVGLWKLFFRVVKFLDIPTFFLRIQTDNPDLGDTVLPLFQEQFPEEDLKIDIVTPGRRYSTSDTLCVHPFNSVYITGKGKYKICCKWQGTLADKDITNTSLHEAQHSTEFRDTRYKMISHKQPSACDSCWKTEQYSKVSMRTSTDQIFPELTYGTDYNAVTHNIRTLDLHLGNVCNLKCRICGPESSSSWVKELNTDSVFQPSWISDQDSNLWQHLRNNLDSLQYITFHGGEPFLDRKHYAIIDHLIAQGRTDVVLHYNTNGTVYPSVLLDKLAQFDSVTLSFSIDNTGAKFEYERHGRSWHTVHNNLLKFAQLDRARFKLEFHTTVSIFNILDLQDLVDLCVQLGFSPHFNLLTSPDYYSVLNIPRAKREDVVARCWWSTNEQVRSFGDLLESEPELDLLEQFWTATQERDTVRNEDFKVTYPEMSAIIL